MKDDNPRLRRFARQMRREPTPAEEAMWRVLRNRRLAGFKFRRQHPLGPHIIDCYCPAARLVIEWDGDTHATPDGQRGDTRRTRYLEARGIMVLRFWNTEVAENPDAVLERIVAACTARAPAGKVGGSRRRNRDGAGSAPRVSRKAPHPACSPAARPPTSPRRAGRGGAHCAAVWPNGPRRPSRSGGEPYLAPPCGERSAQRREAASAG